MHNYNVQKFLSIATMYMYMYIHEYTQLNRVNAALGISSTIIMQTMAVQQNSTAPVGPHWPGDEVG